MGTLYKDLLAFLPLASKPAIQSGVVGAREGLDDGNLGYYPSISVFQGGAAEANFGPEFWFPPEELRLNSSDTVTAGTRSSDLASIQTRTSLKRLRALSERYEEQIAEDVLYDVIDEVDLWVMDGGKLGKEHGTANGGDGDVMMGGVLDGVVRETLGGGGLDGAGDVDMGLLVEGGQVREGEGEGEGELNEIVQDDE